MAESFQLPPPRDASLAACLWLARFVAKARHAAAGVLPASYQRALGYPTGVDGHFLAHFGLQRDAFMRAASIGDDAEFLVWFQAQPGVSSERIAAWNDIALNLGRPGSLMEDHFARALTTAYAHLAPYHPETVFDVLDLDEGREKAR